MASSCKKRHQKGMWKLFSLDLDGLLLFCYSRNMHQGSNNMLDQPTFPTFSSQMKAESGHFLVFIEFSIVYTHLPSGDSSRGNQVIVFITDHSNTFLLGYHLYMANPRSVCDGVNRTYFKQFNNFLPHNFLYCWNESFLWLSYKLINVLHQNFVHVVWRTYSFQIYEAQPIVPLFAFNTSINFFSSSIISEMFRMISLSPSLSKNAYFKWEDNYFNFGFYNKDFV